MSTQEAPIEKSWSYLIPVISGAITSPATPHHAMDQIKQLGIIHLARAKNFQKTNISYSLIRTCTFQIRRYEMLVFWKFLRPY